ncbi:MAG: ABC transporter ATP-binding protein [Chloroflexi bacterium]|nr:ABC transporter ATP-binding protein [Chloroflexota bacterium]
MLSIEGLTVAFGGLRAVDDFSLEIDRGIVLGLIGPNGAGKSTTINAITGFVRPTQGRISLAGKPLAGRSPQEILRAGLARTFQQAQLWAGMTVSQNLALPLEALGRSRASAHEVGEVAERLGIGDLLGLRPSALPFGRRRLVEIGRAIITKPAVVLLDEPGAGLTSAEKANLSRVMRDLAAADTSVLLVDHDMELVMNSCDQVVVLNAGRRLAAGLPKDIREDPAVIAAYLGTSQP